MKRSIWKPLNNTLNPSIGNISLCIFVILRHVTYAYIYDKHKTYKQICFFRNKLLTNENIRLLYKHTYETER